MKPSTVRYIIGALIVAAALAAMRLVPPTSPEVAAHGSAPTLDLMHQQGTDAVIKDMESRPKP